MKRKTEHIVAEYLVINAQLGDRQAQDSLIEYFYPRMLRYAQGILGDKVRAQDAVQSAMMTLHTSLNKVADPKAFVAWLYKTLHFKCVDQIRQNEKQKRVLDAVEEERVSDEANASEAPSAENVSDRTSEALSSLPKPLFEVVHLHYLEDLSIAEISKVINKPEGTIKSRLHKARALLKEKLENGD